jgi:hypothetical protein
MHGDFYDDRRFCKSCQKYVSYLFSTENSFCINCGGPVQLMSDGDLSEFQRSLREGGSVWDNSREEPERETA